MSTRNVAMAAAGWAAVGSSMAAALTIWLLLMRPADLVDAASGGHTLLGVVSLVATTLYEMLLHLLELL